MLNWKEDGRFDLGETSFQTMPPDFFEGGLNLREEDFFIFKPRARIGLYVDLFEELKPERIFELGIYEGGSTLFFAELARPLRIVAVDYRPLEKVIDRLEAGAAASGLADVVRAYGEVDQADRQALARIVEESFDTDLDLVLDDCSHAYGPTRASFNELFPRLRPGGVYVIEDWPWGLVPLGAAPSAGSSEEEPPKDVPVARLLFEILLAIPAMPGLISEIVIEQNTAMIRRGDLEVEPTNFEISDWSGEQGRALLTSG